MPGYEYLNNNTAMKAIMRDVKHHPSILYGLELHMMVIISVASLPFATGFFSHTDFSVLFLLQTAELSAEDISTLLQGYQVVRCCAKCFSRSETLSPCRGCGMATYCSQSCQRDHHAAHERYCKMLYVLRLWSHADHPCAVRTSSLVTRRASLCRENILSGHTPSILVQ